MSTAHRILDGDDCIPEVYKMTHQNHPSAVWTRESHETYSYVYLMFGELCDMYHRSTGRRHATDVKLRRALYNIPKNMNMKKAFTPPPSCMKEEFKLHLAPTTQLHAVENYRNYYLVDKVRFAKFGKYENPEPTWWKDANL